ncbi:MAG TPA: ABC transporter permease [Cytophagales bacterium]|jgi:ABC-2 type transport system permease protein|nr:ABC transporter permease [Cytophagales bacterium]
MRTIFFILRKEFKQIFRNKAMLPLIFVMPMVQLLILPLAADYEVKNINLAVVDHDHSSYSQKLISKISSSGYFRLSGYFNSYHEAFHQIEKDQADLILEIPSKFERNLVRENHEQVFIAVNAINGTKAGLGGSYLTQVLTDFNSQIQLDWVQLPRFNLQPRIDITYSNWFNASMNFQYFMVPGILAILVTMIGSYMTALNIVKEKEIGTIEQINVTPIRKHHFILGKLIPFWILGIFVFSVGLFVVSFLIYGIVPQGNLFLLYGFLSIYLVAILGFGLLVSTYSDTQQQAMSVSFFFVMIFLLMSGLFTPIDSMPEWAKMISRISPITYFIEVMRMVVLKGSTFSDIKFHFLIITGFATVIMSWAILNYRKTT